jgi:hypothetical protein
VEGAVFDVGKLRLKGNFDFLAEPHMALEGDFQIDQIMLDYFKPIIERYGLSVRKGVLSTDGSIEYASQTKRILIKKLSLEDVDADYIHEARNAPGKKLPKEVGPSRKKI